jgi:peptidoglycan/LPS O-acetylase OafA/YrhL
MKAVSAKGLPQMKMALAGLGSVGTGAYVFPMGNGALTGYAVQRPPMRWSSLPGRDRTITLIALLAIMAVVFLVARLVFYEWLPRETAAVIGLVIMAFLLGHLLGERSARRNLRDDTTPNGRR